MTNPNYMIVEDGSALTQANAYWDVESIVQYLLNKGVLDINNYTNDQIARAVISSTMYIEKRFKRRYRGLRQTVEQALGWPRIGAFDDDNFTIFGVPFQVQWACAEYTIRALRLGVLAPDPIRTVPPQDLSQPSPGLTPGSNSLTMTANFIAAETVTIGNRTYTFVSTPPATDGDVAVGGTLATSLGNLVAAINNANNPAVGIFTGTTNFVDGDTITIAQRTYTFRTVFTEPRIDGTIIIGATLAASLLNLAQGINNQGDQGSNVYVLHPDPAVTATSDATHLNVTARVQFALSGFINFAFTPLTVDLEAQTAAGTWGSPTLIQIPNTSFYVTQADQNVVASATATKLVVSDVQPNANSVVTTTTTAHGSWGTATLTGFANNPPDPNLILGPVRSKTEKVGPLEEATTYDGLAQRAAQDRSTTRAAQSGIINDYWLPEYPEADLWIEQILRNPSTGTRLIRGS